MSSKKPIKLPSLRPESVLDEVRRISTEESHNVMIIPHARDRMEHRDITDRQVFNVLKNGELCSDITWCTEGGDRGWKCKLARTTAGDHVRVVAKVVEEDSGNQCLVITLWS